MKPKYLLAAAYFCYYSVQREVTSVAVEEEGILHGHSLAVGSAPP